jgi:predicted small secreted protein
MKAMTTVLAALLVMLASGCNTVQGIGKDVKATGQAMERAAGKAKTY